MTTHPETAAPTAVSTQTVAGMALATLSAGALATVAFDMFGQGLSPLLGYAKLAPVGLAKQSLNVLTGIDSTPAAYLLHAMTGLLLYPLGWLLIAEPLRARIWPSFPGMVAAAIYGVVLFVFALYIMAHLVAGNPPFLGWTGITWVALWGHVVYALAMAGVLRALDRV